MWWRIGVLAGVLGLTAGGGWASEVEGGERPGDVRVECVAKAKRGDAAAQAALGYDYLTGKSGPADPGQAIKWLRKAARQGNADAQCTLGLCYLTGAGVKPNAAEALSWYEAAARQGLAEAEFNVGLCYWRGYGVAQDRAKAIEWYRRAANQGFAAGQFNLGEALATAPGAGEAVWVEAAQWYRRAAVQGLAEAQLNLSLCYAKGLGVKRNETEAYVWAHICANRAESAALRATAGELLDLLAADMSGPQLGQLHRLSRGWQPRKEG